MGFFFPERASQFASSVDRVYAFDLAISVFFSLLIASLIIYFMVKYRRRHPQEVGRGDEPSVLLEVAWTLIPLALTLVAFVWGARVYFEMLRPPSDAAEYYAVGKQWMWKFQHPEGNREINELHVPLGVPIRMTMISQDVIHSFYVPGFRIKMDVLPGRYTGVWFRATRPGTYHLFCAEYCGGLHSGMIGHIVVLEPRDYEVWLASGAPAEKTMADHGAELFAAHACASCHTDVGTSRGPALAGLFGSRVALRDGRTALANDDYLRESILNPASQVVAGYEPVMPTYRGQIGEEDLVQLIRYIRTLPSGVAQRDPAAPTEGGGEKPAGGRAPERRAMP